MISTRARGWTRAACAAAVVWVWVWAGTDGHAGVTATGDVQPANPTTWDTSTDSFVGKTAPGFLRIDGGDRVQSRLAKVGYEAGVTGTVTVDGPQSKWGDMLGLNVGHGGEGALTLTNGGTVYSNYGYVGNRAGSTGTVVVDGANSYWDSREGLWVGYEGTGTLRITGGGGVHSLESYIGEHLAPGDVTVDGLGSYWSFGNSLDIGGPATSTLTLIHGATVSGSNARLGVRSGSTGEVTVDGDGTQYSTSSLLTVGESGNGTLRITHGGVVRNRGGCFLGRWSSGTATVVIDGEGSALVGEHHLRVGWNGTAALSIADEGLLQVAGILTINASLDGNSFVSMASGGRLALFGQADASLSEFLDLIEGTDDIRYWDGSDWNPILHAQPDVNYTLQYIQDGGDLDGYTVLTVPEPTTAGLLSLLGLACLTRRRKRHGRA